MPAYLINYPVFRAVNNLGDPLSGGKLYTYEAGSSNPKATWTDSTQTAANPNPVILNSRGEAAVWLGDDANYRLVLKDALEAQIWEIDDVQGIGSGAAGGGTTQASEWLVQADAPTYISATQFTVAGDRTSVYQVGRRLRAQVSAGVAYSTITASSFGGGNTTVTVENDGIGLDAGISTLSVGINSADNPSIHVSAVVGASPGDFDAGDIKLTARNTPPAGWVWCDGTAYDSIADPATYGALYAAIGNTYGGTDGSNFQVPDLRGRAPMGFGEGDTAEGGGAGTARSIAEKVGAETHTLTESEMPSHTHGSTTPIASNVGASPIGEGTAAVNLGVTAITATGGGAAHNNVTPSLVLGYLIKL